MALCFGRVRSRTRAKRWRDAENGAIKRRELVHCLHQLGFEGPFPRGKHEIMLRAVLRLTLPNPHESDIGTNLLSRILRQAGISREEWERL
jgi:predicted RNA binding protein YcfA (HicA-like mRNA interferase family)